MLTLVIGGNASGKSEYAERHMMELGGPRVYIATMEPFGEEAQARIEKHRAARKDRGFETIECYTGLRNVQLPRGSNVLLEDLGNLVANELFSGNGHGAVAVKEGIDFLLERCTHLTVVTNEVFSGGAGYSRETLRYMRELAEINRYLAGKADLVVEVFCGIPSFLKRPGKGTDVVKHTEKNMIFVTGPLYAGKQEYIQKTMGWTEEEFRQKAVRDVQELSARLVENDWGGSSVGLPDIEKQQLKMKKTTLEQGKRPSESENLALELEKLADELALKEVVIATEIGGGIVPVDPLERRKREAAGMLSRLLAQRADTVIRVSCGLPQVLKKVDRVTVPVSTSGANALAMDEPV